jgi:hypothetical protein
MSLRKPLAALPAVAVALALAAPAVSADAATTAPALRTSHTALSLRLAPGSPACLFLVRQIQFATAIHNIPAWSYWATVAQYAGCGGAAI